MDDLTRYIDAAYRGVPLVLCTMIIGVIIHHTFWHPEQAFNKEVMALATLAGGYLWGRSSGSSK